MLFVCCGSCVNGGVQTISHEDRSTGGVGVDNDVDDMGALDPSTDDGGMHRDRRRDVVGGGVFVLVADAVEFVENMSFE